MKVKVAELKAHLSKYLRRVRESDEAVEICLREEPVAYLTSANASNPSNAGNAAALEGSLRAVELGLAPGQSRPDFPANFAPQPEAVEGKRSRTNTVVSMRREKEY